MANLSQEKRQRMLAFLETIREEHKDDDEVLIALGEIESELNAKKYGLVWERHEEAVDIQMRDNIPVFTECVDKEISTTTGGVNFLLEGDNLHSLRLLEKTHAGRIDLIYIDPPYNTNNKEFIYDDSFVDKTDAFRHSKWLSFMHERLLLVKQLLSKNGSIFISIDSNEQAQLKLLCDEIFGEEKKGDWTTPYMKWRVDEMTGKTEPYSDYANGTTSGVNSEWQTRVQYVFQTSITYGDFEVDMSSTAKVNLAASKQRAAANVIDIDQNRFYLLGVAGKEIYGILNDPNLPAAITAGATGTGGSTKWADKTTVQIYNDVLALFAQLSEQSSGLIDKDTPLKLCLSPELAVRLGAATDFNVSVLDMLKRYFTRIDIVTVPELHSMTAGENMFLIAPEVNGQRSGTLAFGEKMRAGRVVPDLSSFRQKFVGTTYGGIVLMPFAFAQMTGA